MDAHGFGSTQASERPTQMKAALSHTYPDSTWSFHFAEFLYSYTASIPIVTEPFKRDRNASQRFVRSRSLLGSIRRCSAILRCLRPKTKSPTERDWVNDIINQSLTTLRPSVDPRHNPQRPPGAHISFRKTFRAIRHRFCLLTAKTLPKIPHTPLYNARLRPRHHSSQWEATVIAIPRPNHAEPFQFARPLSRV